MSGARRARFGVATAGAAGIASMAVLGFDLGEKLAQDALGIDGGPRALGIVVAGFVVLWALATLVLARWSPSPMREGVYAGALVALVMAARLAVAAIEFGPWVLLLLVPFGALAVGLGAAGGALAGLAQRPSQGQASTRTR